MLAYWPIRYKLLFGTDSGWWSFGKKPAPEFSLIDSLDLPAEVAGFEPHLALDGGEDGLGVYRRLLGEARKWLSEGGTLAVELDERRVRTAAEEAIQWYEDVRVVSDLAGRDRIVTARLAKRS